MLTRQNLKSRDWKRKSKCSYIPLAGAKLKVRNVCKVTHWGSAIITRRNWIFKILETYINQTINYKQCEKILRYFLFVVAINKGKLGFKQGIATNFYIFLIFQLTLHAIETKEIKLISKQFLTSGAEIFSQLGGVLLYGRAEAEIPLLSNKKRIKNYQYKCRMNKIKMKRKKE